MAEVLALLLTNEEAVRESFWGISIPFRKKIQNFFSRMIDGESKGKSIAARASAVKIREYAKVYETSFPSAFGR